MAEITLEELCRELERTGHRLEPRTARSWWTRGLLPVPKRRGRGRAKGTETYWSSSAVVAQARAACDLLDAHGRTYSAVVSLWALGHPVPLRRVRPAWTKLIERNTPWEHGRDRALLPEDAVGELAGRIARSLMREGAPRAAREATADLLVAILNAFYLAEDEGSQTDLAGLYTSSCQHWKTVGQPLAEVQIAWLLECLSNWASLPSQRNTLATASDAELERARRVVRLLFGLCSRQFHALPPAQQEEMRPLGERLQLMCGRVAILPLVCALRDPIAAPVVPLVRDMVRRSRNIDWNRLRREAPQH